MKYTLDNTGNQNQKPDDVVRSCYVRQFTHKVKKYIAMRFDITIAK